MVSIWPVARIASSSGLAIPVCSEALSTASSLTWSEISPRASRARSMRTTPSVMVPVLSVHSVSMLPKFSMEFRRLTMTPCFVICWAPLERLMVMMAGRSSGAMPTARATAKSRVSSAGLSRMILIARTARTRALMIRVKRMPNFRIPCSNSVSSGRSDSRFAISPNLVAAPVSVISTLAVPLRTLVPENTILVRSASSASTRVGPTFFSTGKVSPVRTD